MAFKEFVVVVIVISLFYNPLKALQSDWSLCHNSADCGHRTLKTSVCVDCRNFGIETIGSWVNQSLETLKYVYLNGNKIKRLPKGTFGNLKQLKWLDLSSNRINHIDLFWAGNASRLEGLDLSSNLISALIRPMFLGLSSLRNLYLWDNIISILDSGWSDGLQVLRHLIISHNRLSVVANITFGGLDLLETLHLQFNNITDIEDGWTQDLNNLRNLDMSYNNIAIINRQTFVNLTSLDTLNLRHNPILDFDLPVNHVLPMLKTLYVSYIEVRNISLWLETIPQNLRILYVDDGQWNLTDEEIRSNLSYKDIDIVVEESRMEYDLAENTSVDVRAIALPQKELSSSGLLCFLLLLVIGLVVAIVAASCCLNRKIVKQRRYKNDMRKKQSIVYVPFTESLKIRNSAANSRCGTLDSHHQDGSKIQGCSTDEGPRSERYTSGVAAAFSELRKVQCSSDTRRSVVSKLGQFSLDSGYDRIIDEETHQRKPTEMISFKPMGYCQRRRNSLPDRPLSQFKDGWVYEVIPDKIPCTSNAGNNLAKVSRDSRLLYQNITGRCWTSRAERIAPQQMTNRKKTPKYNLLRSLSTPLEVESDTEPLWSEYTDAPPPVLPRPLITLTSPSSNVYEDVDMLLSQEWGRRKEGAQNKDLASTSACRVDDNDCRGGTGEAELYNEVFDDEDNYIVVLPSETDNLPETTAGERGIEPLNKHQKSENLYDKVHDSEDERQPDYMNAAFNELLNGDDQNAVFPDYQNRDGSSAAFTEDQNYDHVNGTFSEDHSQNDGNAQITEYPSRDYVHAFFPDYPKQDDVNDTSIGFQNRDDINAAFTGYPNENDANAPLAEYPAHDKVDDGYLNRDVNGASTEYPNSGDFKAECPNREDNESLDDYTTGLPETDNEIVDDRIQLYGDDRKLLRIPSVRDSVSTGSTFETISLLAGLSDENIFSSTSSSEFDDDDVEEKPRKVGETHTL